MDLVFGWLIQSINQNLNVLIGFGYDKIIYFVKIATLMIKLLCGVFRKRYDKAEKEFVSAKLDLKVKSDIKEELTQHLYTIIQENELRKSKKLEELLSKLNATENTTAINCITDHVIEKEKL